MRETNDALEVAWKGEREAKRAWSVAGGAKEKIEVSCNMALVQ